MRNSLIPVYRNTILILFLIVFSNSGFAANARALTLDEQRSLYNKAMQYVRTGNIRKFRTALAELGDYPLYPYLHHAYLKPRLKRASADEVRWFLENFDDLPDTEKLRTRWLLHLARQKRWQEFQEFYTPQSDNRLQCLHLQARVHTGNQIYLLEDIRSTWLRGESLPDECDGPFRILYESELMDDDLIWQRIRLTMENGKLGLANFLGRKLTPELKTLQQHWVRMHHNPRKFTARPDLDDNAQAREILLYGIERLARRNIKLALQRWEDIRDHYSYTAAEIARLQRNLALRAARDQHPDAARLLDRVDPALVDAEVFLYRLRLALQGPDWRQLLDWTSGFPPFPGMTNQWWYWHGRALQETGDIDAARQAFRRIGHERDYYGFMAADRLGYEYRMNHFPLPENLKDRQIVLETPAIKRAHEFYQLGKYYLARREWHHALNRMTRLQMQVAAMIAKEWGWYDRAIFTLGKAKMYDDLVLRFPLLYRDLLEKYAGKRDLDLGWMYGLVRAESAFVEDARSPAGAMGLMQVMPVTGLETARNIGFKDFNKKMLMQARYNVPIGSAYLKQMLKRFGNNPVLATAAYNAGPHRVKQWLPDNGCSSPDVWVELIPFNETRKYVKRVLAYAIIYDWRLDAEPVLLSQRMPAVLSSKQQSAVAGLSCSTLTVSLN
ncbi:MAG: transglycosylase SLT domain-containing protein [Thiotrichales bacterium]|nr:transglycosylase SLT domain-containing protein [Thiotrichales bacterium]